MKFDGKNIGGRETGPIRFGFRGDEKLGQQYVPIARQFMGDLKRRMELSQIENKAVYQQEDFTTLPDGTVIYANSIFGGEGAADIDDVIIDTRKTVKKKKDVSWRCIGFVANAIAPDGGLATVIVKPPFGEDYQYIDTYSNEAPLKFRLTWQLMNGLIPTTYEADPAVDPAIDPDDWEWRGVPFFWVRHTVSESAPIFHTPFQGSVNPIPIADLIAENAAQPPAMSNISGIYQLLPAERNAKQHVGMVGKPINVTAGEVIYERSTSNAFSVVLPGKVKLTPDTVTWPAYQNQFGNARTVNYVGLINVWNGEAVASGPYTGTYIGDIGEGLNYTCYAKNEVTYNTDAISQLQLDADVPTGTYYVIGFPDIKIIALFESTGGDAGLKSFTFEATGFLTEAIKIEVGVWSAVMEDLVKRVDAVSKFTSEIDEQGLQRIHWVIT